MDRGTAERKTSSRHEPGAYRSGALLFGLVLLLLAICGSPPVQAQDGGSPAVIVNQDILNNLEWAAAAAAQARARAGTSATLLPSPETAPQSRLLVKPTRQAAAPPIPGAKPARAAEPEQTPEPSAPEPATADTQEADTWSGYAIAAEPAGAGSLPAVPPPPEPPAAEETSLATVPPPAPPAPPETAAPAVAPGAESLQAAAAEAPDAGAPATDEAVTQTAMVAAPELSAGEFRLLFEAGATSLSETAKGRLAALAEQLRAAPERRIQVRAFAGGEASARDARRLSLSRAVAVRSFLIEQGLPARQIDVRALGGDSGSGPADRVDVLDTSG